jgi:alpha-tubulin suppressor-like RCC1 family protein
VVMFLVAISIFAANDVAESHLPIANAASSTLYQWGANYNVTHNNPGNDYLTPSVVTGPLDVTALDVATSDAYAIDGNGYVWGWGDNSQGELGIGSAKRDTKAVVVSGISNVIQTATGFDWAMALESNGTLWSWGWADGGFQLGTGSSANQLQPVQIIFPPAAGSITQIAAAGCNGLALDSNDDLWVWGCNNHGQLGLGVSSPANVATPVELSGLSGRVTEISAGCATSAALLADGTVDMWGNNSQGQLGNGTKTTAWVPTPVANLSGVMSISTGGNAISNGHTLAVTTSGVYVWGTGTSGQLGTGKTKDSTVPLRVNALPDGIVAVAAGGINSLALDSDGNVWSWGGNKYGQVGNGTTENQLTPEMLSSVSGVNLITAGPFGSEANS